MKLTFGIIGYGRFGKLWAKTLSAFGNVLVYDRKGEAVKQGKVIPASLRQACRADILFLLVPISEMENCCGQIKNMLLPSTVVVDACSVKVWPVKVMKKTLKLQPIIATHPLFGPDSAKRNGGLQGLQIAVCPVSSSPKQLRLLLGIFKRLGLQIILTTPEQHDLQMARSQGLIHFIGRGLAGLKLKPQKIFTPDYLSLLYIQDMVLNDTWQLFFDMQKYNKFVKPVRKKFLFNLMNISATINHQKKNVRTLRGQIDHLDELLIKTIAQRMKVSKKIGLVKKKQKLKVLDKGREKEIALRHGRLSRAFGLDPKEIAKIFANLLTYSKKLQK